MSGVLNLVSVGPGENDLIVPRAQEALKNSDVIVGYELYLRWIAPWLEGKDIHTPPLTQERERARLADSREAILRAAGSSCCSLDPPGWRQGIC